MPEKVYEMPDDYKQAMADLLEFIKIRDEAIESLKIQPPERQKELRELIALLNKKIEEGEAALATEYEATQAHLRAKDELNEVQNDVYEKMVATFIYVKHNLPEKLDEVKATIFNGVPEEEIQAFYDRVAIREATQLEEIIAEAPKEERDERED